MLLFYDWNNEEYGMKFYKSFDVFRSVEQPKTIRNIQA